jgi:hypothetical protein
LRSLTSRTMKSAIILESLGGCMVSKISHNYLIMLWNLALSTSLVSKFWP